MILIKPKIVALDTSHYVQIIRDLNSANGSYIRRAKDFQKALVDHGYVTLFTFHHISELIKHRSTAIGRDSIAFIRSLAATAWIPSYTNHEIAGAITDIFASEVAAALDIDDPTAAKVRAITAKAIIKIGSGEEAVRPYLGNWQQLQPYLWDREEKAREIMALSASNILKNANLKISDILDGKIRPQSEASRILKAMLPKLTSDLQEYGDKKLFDHTQTATQFLKDVHTEGENLNRSSSNPIIDFLKTQGIDLEDIKTIKRPEEFGELAVFRKQLKIIADSVDIDWPTLKQIKPSTIPSWVIQSELSKNRDRKLRRDGSELTDRHLASLAAYADVTYVDKRIYENISRARRRSTIFSTITGRIEKARHYTEVTAHLKMTL